MVTTGLQDEVRRVRMVPFQTLRPACSARCATRPAAKTNTSPSALMAARWSWTRRSLRRSKTPCSTCCATPSYHGIETPEEREAAGKPAEGQIRLTVRQQGSEVHIAVQDDGRGFDVEALRRSSADNGGPAFDGDANPNEIIAALAFRPGITTMQHVTELAGRGVGLDVVRQTSRISAGGSRSRTRRARAPAFSWPYPSR